MTSGGHIGGDFKVTANPAFLDTRSAYFDTLWAVQEASIASIQASNGQTIKVTLPDGSVKEGVAFKTSPYDIAKAISTGLADSIIIAKVSIWKQDPCHSVFRKSISLCPFSSAL